MIRNQALRLNTFWSLGANIGYLASQWALLMVLAKVGGPQLVGVYSFGLAVTSPLMMFAAFRLRLLQATDSKNQFTFQQFLGFRVIVAGVAILGLVVLTLATANSTETRSVIWWIGIAKAIDLFSQTCHGLWQKHERMHLIALSRSLNGFGTFLTVGLGLWLSYSLPQVMFLSAVVSLIVFLTFDCQWVVKVLRQNHLTSGSENLRESLRPDFDSRQLRALFVLALPLAIATGLMSLDANLPRVVIEKQLGPAELGIFAGLSYIMLAGSTIVDAIGNAISPSLSGLYVAGDVQGLQRLTYKLVLSSGVLTLGGVILVLIAGKPIVTLVYSPEFAQHTSLLAWLTLATGVQFAGTILTFGMVASRNLRSQAYIQLVSIGFGLVCYYTCISAWGLQGAAIASLFLAIFRAALLWGSWRIHLRHGVVLIAS